jgi:hypothetical protein
MAPCGKNSRWRQLVTHWESGEVDRVDRVDRVDEPSSIPGRKATKDAEAGFGSGCGACHAAGCKPAARSGKGRLVFRLRGHVTLRAASPQHGRRVGVLGFSYAGSCHAAGYKPAARSGEGRLVFVCGVGAMLFERPPADRRGRRAMPARPFRLAESRSRWSGPAGRRRARPRPLPGRNRLRDQSTG